MEEGSLNEENGKELVGQPGATACCRPASGKELAVLTVQPPVRGAAEPQVLSAVQRAGPRYRKVEVLVDSGAAECVANPSDFPEYPVLESEGSKDGVNYYMADGTPVANEGEQHLKGRTEEGTSIATIFQSCRVSRPILAVSRMAEQGNEVQFHKGGGVIRNMKTGAETRFYRKGGVYVLALWVRVDQHKGDEEHSFHRQGT